MSKRDKEEFVQSEMLVASSEKLSVLRFRFSTRLNDVLFPIDGRELADALAKAGYSIPPKLPPARARATIRFTGEIARKNGVIVDGNSDRGVLGVTAKSWDSAINSYNELSSIIQSDLDINIDERSRFFEIIAEYKIESPKNPLKSIGNIFSKNRIIKNVNDIFEQKTSMYSLRFTPQEKIPNQEEWLDITIEPDLTKPTSIYNVSVIFRSVEKEKVLNFGKALQTRLLKLIDAI